MVKETQITVLRVAEAKAKDVGRGIVRIDPQDLEKMEAEVGDIVEIEGKRKTVAKVMPAYPEDRGKSLIQMDGLLRGNAQVSLDEKVNLRKTDGSPAEKIVLSHLTLVKSIKGEGDAKYIGTLLDGLPLIEGDTIRANLFGTRSQDFTVISTIPKGRCGDSVQYQNRDKRKG